ncbi:MAG: hypothetical protein WC976_06685 [Caldisericia bacterium]
MTRQDKQIVTKAIAKAQGAGWMENYRIEFRGDGICLVYRGLGIEQVFKSVNDILFGVGFMKAFWGWGDFFCPKCDSSDINPVSYGYICNGCNKSIEPVRIVRWKYHPQKMLFVKDRLKYIKKFL